MGDEWTADLTPEGGEVIRSNMVGTPDRGKVVCYGHYYSSLCPLDEHVVHKQTGKLRCLPTTYFVPASTLTGCIIRHRFVLYWQVSRIEALSCTGQPVVLSGGLKLVSL